MKNILNVAFYTAKRFLRDWGSMAEMLIFPVVLIFILGMALSGQFAAPKMQAIPIAYVAQGSSVEFDQYIQHERFDELLDITTVSSLDQGNELLRDNQVYALLYVDGQDITIYSLQSSMFNEAVLQDVMDGFMFGANTVMTVYEMTGDIQNFQMVQGVAENPIQREGNAPDAMGYYAVTMLVMIMMSGAFYAISGMGEDHLQNIGSRVRSTPIKSHQLYAGKTLANVGVVFMQSVVVLLFTRLVYGVSWGNEVGGILLICLLASFFSTGLGALSILLIRNISAASGIVNALIVGFTFIGGGFFQVEGLGPLFQMIKHISPNYLFHTMMFNLIYEGPKGVVIQYGIIMIGVTVLLFAATSILGRRKLI